MHMHVHAMSALSYSNRSYHAWKWDFCKRALNRARAESIYCVVS